ncbi:hypothetical protein L249_7449 [Ophiocordyceps polyrhachis-furcata BCC 54312]|uniref:Uncharacterized protein n=1 Tax=Ophiocordyceps polyrhachis-furcata BCC 54312 TaxID=1330021 RepID=A0A367L9L9_9HYPO|nr:hypothetical protein L249_7449 [Ophiocordyceps polyrhachis-furcata BCC 54312]
MAPSAAPPDGAPGDTVGVPIDPFVETRFYNPMRPGRNRPRPPYSLPPPPHYPRDHLSSNRY